MDDLQRLSRIAAMSRASDTRATRHRAERNALIVEILDKGEQTQAAVCRATGLTREHIRRIVEAERQRHATPPDAPPAP